MDNVLDDLLNKVDNINIILYHIDDDLQKARNRVIELEEYIQSIKNIKSYVM